MVWVLIFFGLAGACLAATTAFFLRRASQGRRELSLRLHQTALGLDQRCDVLGEQIRTLDQRQRIDHLIDLIDQGRVDSWLSQDVTTRLRRFALELRGESFAARS